jgi:predicted MPP superfamily phosphohydrolase
VSAVTFAHFWFAAGLFHLTVLAGAWVVVRSWREHARSVAPLGPWSARLGRDLCVLVLGTYLASLAAPLVVSGGNAGHRTVGAISGRLMSQACFGEAILLAAWWAACHWRAQARARAIVFTALAVAWLCVYVDAYHVEPRLLFVRRFTVDRSVAGEPVRTIRILHVSDIQTDVVGAHEEDALLRGLAEGPDLIVLTGDYVEDALGRPTEAQAARDLRALMAHIGFTAPLGVFATDGDAGLSCRETFAGRPVHCLVDESVEVALSDGDSLVITGLSRTRGRERDPLWLARLLERGPSGRHRLVISHAPDFVDALPVKVDLVLAGHTHGGQVVIPFFGPPVTGSRLPRRYAGGLHAFEGIPLHVSRGVGMERAYSPPVRFLCPPEIGVIDLRLAR